MSIQPYIRGSVWWIKGRIDQTGGRYYRESLGIPSTESAERHVAAFIEREVRRSILGNQASLTFSEAVMLYDAKPSEAGYLMPVVDEIGDMFVSQITPQMIRNLGPKMKPNTCADTWLRQIIAPVRAVINNAHDLGRCPPIRIKGYSQRERLDQDRKRGKASRQPKTPGSWEWIGEFSEHASPYLVALAEFMFETGARVGQATALKPEDLDLQNARVWMPESKGHPAQWVTISMQMVVRLANLPARRPHNRQTGQRQAARVFGYASRTGPLKAWRTACANAGIEYLPPHSAGRHGFATELYIRKGVDPVTVAKSGRWSNPVMVQRVYSHAETSEADIREKIRSKPVHDATAHSVRPLERKAENE